MYIRDNKRIKYKFPCKTTYEPLTRGVTSSDSISSSNPPKIDPQRPTVSHKNPATQTLKEKLEKEKGVAVWSNELGRKACFREQRWTTLPLGEWKKRWTPLVVLPLSTFPRRTYSFTNRATIRLIHETSRANRRRSIIFIFSLTANHDSAWFVHRLRPRRRPDVPLLRFSFSSPPWLKYRRAARRVHPKSEETHQHAADNPRWKKGNDDSFLGPRMDDQFLFTRRNPAEFKR